MYRPNIKQVILHYIIHSFHDHLGCLSVKIFIGTQNIRPVRPQVSFYFYIIKLKVGDKGQEYESE